MTSPDYLAFLDRRIPELQNEGKPLPGPAPAGATIEERIARIRPNMDGSKYPGVKARRQADLEWAAMKKEQTA